MRCFTPSRIRLPEEENTTNQFQYRSVPCGKCQACLIKRQKGWTFRLMEEAKVSESAAFLTLTYDHEHVKYTPKGLPNLDKVDFPAYVKRLRKNTGKKGIKYYACGEYGTNTGRPHMHAIMFNAPLELTQPNFESEQHGFCWRNGRVQVDKCNNQTIAYVCGYVTKKLAGLKPIVDDDGNRIKDDRKKEFSLMSKNMGLSFLTPQMVKFIKSQKAASIDMVNYHIAIPRYYRDRIFNDQEKLEIEQKGLEYLIQNAEKEAGDIVKYKKILEENIRAANYLLKQKRLTL